MPTSGTSFVILPTSAADFATLLLLDVPRQVLAPLLADFAELGLWTLVLEMLDCFASIIIVSTELTNLAALVAHDVQTQVFIILLTYLAELRVWAHLQMSVLATYFVVVSTESAFLAALHFLDMHVQVLAPFSAHLTKPGNRTFLLVVPDLISVSRRCFVIPSAETASVTAFLALDVLT